jgi:hypothetical protein
MERNELPRASQVAQKLTGSGKKCQGTTSVVPKKANTDCGL